MLSAEFTGRFMPSATTLRAIGRQNPLVLRPPDIATDRTEARSPTERAWRSWFIRHYLTSATIIARFPSTEIITAHHLTRFARLSHNTGMALSAAEHLELVDAAIQRALTSQEYEIGSGAGKRRQVNANLTALYQQRADLLAEISAGTGSAASLGEMEMVR